MSKRAADTVPKRAYKRKKQAVSVNHVPVVVAALSKCEALPEDLRTVFEVALPTVFGANKVDRHAYESEIVAQAEKSLVDVQAAIEKKHAEALAAQNSVIAPEEHARRTKAKEAAESSAKDAEDKFEEKKEKHATAKKAVHDAKGVLKAAEKDAQHMEKEMQANSEKKASLTEVLASEFVLLKDGTSNTPEGKKAVKTLEAIGKQYKLDNTLFQTLPLTCKKEPENRTEFEVMMFTSLKAAIDREIDSITQKAAEQEPGKASKLATVATAKEALEKAEASLSAVNEELSAAQAANKEAQKEVTKADHYLYKIWSDMKAACDAQDELAAEIKNFSETIVAAFEQLKEKQPAEESAAEDAAEDPADEGANEEAAPADEPMEEPAEEGKADKEDAD